MNSEYEAARQVALQHARLAAEHGDVPVGAVVMCNGITIVADHDERETAHDPAAHAEILTLHNAAKGLGRWIIDDCDLVVTLEPCVMCAGFLINARIRPLVSLVPPT